MDNKNARKLYYLSQLVELMNQDNLQIGSYVAENMVEVFGINDRTQLAYAAKVMRRKINQKLMLDGVSMEDPESTYISPNVKIGKDTIIYPNTTIMGKSVLGNANIIGPNAVLENVKTGNNVVVKGAFVSDTTLKDNEVVGPFVKK
jgi:bifunctional UDP-N-acetylglucosamine pyrophosphorylase/glucosamine-1-phosphate N-acetyltransferase